MLKTKSLRLESLCVALWRRRALEWQFYVREQMFNGLQQRSNRMSIGCSA